MKSRILSMLLLVLAVAVVCSPSIVSAAQTSSSVTPDVLATDVYLASATITTSIFMAVPCPTPFMNCSNQPQDWPCSQLDPCHCHGFNPATRKCVLTQN